jgi:hypothetical protein
MIRMKHNIMAFRFFTLSSSVHVKIELKSRPIVSSRLYRFENTKTWHEVFVEVWRRFLSEENMKFVWLSQTDRDTRLSPILEEPIQVVQEFDSALTFATFVVNRYASSSEENDINNECEQETSSTPSPPTPHKLLIYWCKHSCSAPNYHSCWMKTHLHSQVCSDTGWETN